MAKISINMSTGTLRPVATDKTSNPTNDSDQDLQNLVPVYDKVAVYKLDRETFTISIYAVRDGVFEVLATRGKDLPGGKEFDETIVQYWMEKNKLDIPTIQQDLAFMQKLRLKAEAAKIALSTQNLYNEKLDDIWCTLNKQTFEELIADQVAGTLLSCQQAMDEAGMARNSIQKVILIGGPTRTPYIQAQVNAFFEQTPEKN